MCRPAGGFSNEKGLKLIEKATVSGRLSSLLPVVFSGRFDCIEQSVTREVTSSFS